MLDTPQERVELLKAGYDMKIIEEMYVFDHNLTILLDHNNFEFVDLIS